jgi:histidinol-phosphate aminotransferase
MGLVRPHLLDAPPYVPVQPPDQLAKQLGLSPDQLVKLDGNENQYGASPKALAALAESGVNIYPDPEQRRLRLAIANYVGYGPEWVVAGQGSDELIELVLRLFLAPGESILNFPPTFGMYSFLANVMGGQALDVRRRPDYSLDLEAALAAAPRTKLVFAVSPNNPTGTLLSGRELEALLATGLPVVVDEAYAEFSGQSYVDLVKEQPNLIVLRTLSKWAGLAGLRLGFMVADPRLVDLVLRIKQPYSVNVAAEAAALASFEDLSLLQGRVEAIVVERSRMAELLAQLPGLEVTPSAANFLLCRLSRVHARDVHERLRQRGVLVRYFDTPLLQSHLRISVGRREQTDTVVEALRQVLAELAAQQTGARVG